MSKFKISCCSLRNSFRIIYLAHLITISSVADPSATLTIRIVLYGSVAEPDDFLADPDLTFENVRILT
jgi:hypothetical protein